MILSPVFNQTFEGVRSSHRVAFRCVNQTWNRQRFRPEVLYGGVVNRDGERAGHGEIREGGTRKHPPLEEVFRELQNRYGGGHFVQGADHRAFDYLHFRPRHEPLELLRVLADVDQHQAVKVAADGHGVNYDIIV